MAEADWSADIPVRSAGIALPERTGMSALRLKSQFEWELELPAFAGLSCSHRFGNRRTCSQAARNVFAHGLAQPQGVRTAPFHRQDPKRAKHVAEYLGGELEPAKLLTICADQDRGSASKAAHVDTQFKRA